MALELQRHRLQEGWLNTSSSDEETWRVKDDRLEGPSQVGAGSMEPGEPPRSCDKSVRLRRVTWLDGR
jgi:hypothetical protein